MSAFTTTQTDASRFARWTGAILLIVTLTHMAGFQITNQFHVSGDFTATAANIVQNEALYRLALNSYLLSSVLSVGLAVGFYLIVAPISQAGAILVLAGRLAEAMIGCAAWAVRFAVLENQTAAPFPGQESLHVTLRTMANAGFDTSALCLAVASLVGFGLMLKARTIPRVLSLAALLGALSVLVSSAFGLLGISLAISSHLAFALTLLSQLAIGGWLLIRGVHVGERQLAMARSPESKPSA